MNMHEEDEIKKEFQLERLIFFSDAVFAIIITIMVLDIKLPQVNSATTTEKQLLQTFLHIIPQFTAYTASFIIIGRLWMKHLRIFSFLKDFNRQLIALNLLFLFSISLFPFALSFVFISTQYMRYPWGIYTYIGIIYFTYFTQTLLIGYLIRNRDELCLRANELDNAVQWKIRRIEFLATPIFVWLIIAASYFHFSAYIVFGLLGVYRIIILVLKRRYYPNYRKEQLTLRSFFVRHKRVTISERV
jgi:uncharacterized membrane protein